MRYLNAFHIMREIPASPAPLRSQAKAPRGRSGAGPFAHGPQKAPQWTPCFCCPLGGICFRGLRYFCRYNCFYSDGRGRLNVYPGDWFYLVVALCHNPVCRVMAHSKGDTIDTLKVSRFTVIVDRFTVAD